MLHAADHQITYFYTLAEVTKQNVKDTTDIYRKLRDSIRNFSLQLHIVEADLLDSQRQFRSKYAVVRQFER